MALNFLKQLRSIEEKGSLPSGNDINYSGKPLTQSTVSRGNKVRGADSESKDGLSPDHPFSSSDILSIVDDPYSKNDIEAHKEHSLSAGLLKKLLSTSGTRQPQRLIRSDSSTATNSRLNRTNYTQENIAYVKDDSASLSSAETTTNRSSANATLRNIDKDVLSRAYITNHNVKPPKAINHHSQGWNSDTNNSESESGRDHKLTGTGMSADAQSAFYSALFARELARNGQKPHPAAKDAYIQGLQIYSNPSERSLDREHDVNSVTTADSRNSSVRAYQQAIQDREKYSQEMQRAKSQLSKEMQKNASVIEANIGKAVEFLPTDLLMKYGKFEIVRERALTKMWNILMKMRINLLRLAKKRWIVFVKSSNQSIRLAAGALIVRIARGCLGRMRYRRRREEYLESERKKGRLNAVKRMGIIPRIILIQSAVRRFHARRRVAPILREHRAAKFVQLFMRMRIVVIFAKRAVRLRRLQKHMAIIIQKHVRARRGRKRFREKKKEHMHALMKLKYETSDSTFKWYFEQNGAAAKIQHWFRNLPWHVKRKFARTYLPYYKLRKAIWMDATGRLADRKKKKKKRKGRDKRTGKDTEYAAMAQKRMSANEKRSDIADAVNHIVRGFLARRKVKRIRLEIQRKIELCRISAIMIQKTIRRVLVAMKMPWIGARIRSSQRKYRRWRSSQNFRVIYEHKKREVELLQQREEEERRRAESKQKAKSRVGKANHAVTDVRSRPSTAAVGERPASSTSTTSVVERVSTAKSNSSTGSKSNRPSSKSGIVPTERVVVQWWKDSDQHVYVPPTARQRSMEDVVSTSSDALLPLHLSNRRNTIDVGTRFKITRAKDIPYMDTAARRIARAFRAFLARVKFKAFMENKCMIYATKLQKWGVYMTLRRRVVRLRRFIVEETGLWARVLRRRAAATKIQRRAKVHASMVWLRNFKAKRTWAIAQLFRFYRRRIKARKAVKAAIRYRRSLLETREAGAQQYDRTVLCALVDAFWEGASQIKSLNVPYDLQKFFQTTGSGGMLESSRFAKVMATVATESDLFGEDRKKKSKKKSKKIDGDVATNATVAAAVDDEESAAAGNPLDTKIIENMFLKVKALNDKRIDYPCFLDLLCNLGAIRFIGISEALLPNGEKLAELTKAITQIDAKQGSGPRGLLSETERTYELNNLVQEGTMTQDQLQMVEKIIRFEYGRKSGRPALITKFCMTYIALSQDYKKAVLALGKKATSVEAESAVAKSVETLQNWARNRLGIKSILRQWKSIAARKIAAKRYKAATNINNMCRRFLGKIHIMKIAQNTYSKFLDQESGAVYWFNPRTEKSFWTKPTMLGSKDCGNPVSMPHPDEQYIVLCSLCDPDDNPNSATTFCDECNDVYCPNCFKVAHKSARMSGHKTIPLTLCVQCDFQAASRRCIQCKDMYCDNCYKVAHARGRLKLHIFETCTQQCTGCHNRAAQWVYQSNDGRGIEQFYCIPCTRQNIHINEGATIRVKNASGEIPGEAILTRFKFKGASVLAFLGAREEENKRKAVAEDFARRKAEQHEQSIQRAATRIQRRWRGYKDRKDIKEFQKERREFFSLRKAQMYLRENVLYKFLQYWGAAPQLTSDTLLERVLNSYPVHMHGILAECINDKWKVALKLQRAQDEHLQKFGNPSKLMLYMKQWDARSKAMSLKVAERKLARKLADLEVRKVKYRDTRARGDAKKEQVAALQKAAEDAAKIAEAALEAKNKLETEATMAQQTVSDFIGPRGLQSLVADRRKNGILMPFRLHLHQGSRIAEVTWEEPPDYAAIAAAKAAAEAAAEQAAIEAAKLAAKSKKKGKLINDIPIAPIVKAEEEDPEEHKSRYIMQFEKIQAEKAALEEHDKRRQPIKNDEGKLILDENGKAIDGYGQLLDVNPETGEAVLSDETKPPLSEDPKNMNPNYGTWINYVHAHDILLVNGGSFQIIPRVDFIQHMKLATEIEEIEENEIQENKDEDEDEEEAEIEKKEIEIDEHDIDYQDILHMKKDLQIMSHQHSDDYICLDRPWVLESVEFQPVCKIIPPKFYVKPIKAVAKNLVCNYFSQKAIQFAAINIHKMANVSNMISTLFDAESDTGDWFRQNAERMNRYKWHLVQSSREVTHFTYDFKLRRTIWKKVTHQVQTMKRAFRALRNRAAAVTGDDTAGLNFEFWEDSKTKTSVQIYMDLGLHGEVLLGEITFDLKAPIHVMRQYLYRNNAIRDALNTQYHGENFQFFVVKENENYDGQVGDSVQDWILDREAEKTTFSSDFCYFKINNKTMEGATRCSLVLDANNTEMVKIHKLDKQGNIILEEGDEGYKEWLKEQGKKGKASKGK